MRVAREISKDRQTTSTKIKTDLQLPCSSRTIRRSIQKSGFKHVAAVKKPRLNRRMIEQRKAVANTYLHWNEGDWSKVSNY